MNGTLAQLLSIISYGNRFLNNQNLPEAYYPENVAFKFCNQVNFFYLDTQSDGTSMETEVAASPSGWFDLLRQHGCTKIKAYYHPSRGNDMGTPDHKLAGFVGGGGTWLIEAIYPAYSEFWSGRWTVTKRNDPDKNIWSVNYGRTVAQSATIDFCPDVVATRLGLAQTLNEIAAFASRHQLQNWETIFRRAISLLDSASPAEGWYEQLIDNESYELPALQLIHAAISADVFGGMGSWNDLGFNTAEENKIYDDLSAQLYDWVNRALVSCINSYPK